MKKIDIEKHLATERPFLLKRVDRSFLQYHVPKGSTSMPPHNMYVTTSGNFLAAAFKDRQLYEDNATRLEFALD